MPPEHSGNGGREQSAPGDAAPSRWGGSSVRDAAGGHPRVMLITEPWGAGYAAVEGSPLEGRAIVSRVDWQDSMPGEERAARFDAGLLDAEALVFAPWLMRDIPPFTAERWSMAPRLKVIAGTFDNRFGGWLGISGAAARGVTVVDTSRSMTPTVAEYVLAMTLNLLRDIPTAVQLVREGSWKPAGWDQPGFVYGDLTGRRVGLAGYGSINRRYAELLEPFRCSVMAYDPHVAPADLERVNIEPVGSLVELASRSEIFAIGIPPTPATRRIISSQVLDALPRGALVISVTRMAVVDQTALWRRAEKGEIRAAVDVFDPEPPPPDASFRSSPWVLPTPHIAGDAAYCHRRCFTTACSDALAVLAGERPRYRATAHDELLYRGDLEEGSERHGE